MYLKALEIQGFKSFPDKTVLHFGEDITAVVGPNGSGKSNISDAICWVMGEQSARSLRGVKMEDVIFSGTAKRKPVGFAQVTLVLDNSGQMFPAIDSSEVQVTRRYYRSGESEFYINKQSVRLKDVCELFMDTGLGREGYSIIGQGKIDEILSQKSVDRREIFEEAAGISKYRHRKEEAERRLARTEENLVRINDKIAELELQVEPLREEAEKAKRYLILRDEMRSLEISLWLQKLDEIKTGAMKLQADCAAARAQKEDGERQLEALYRENESCSQKMQENELRQEQCRQEAAQREALASEEDSAVAVLAATAQHSRESMELLRRELESQELRSQTMDSQMEEQRLRIQSIEERREALQRELDELMEEVRRAAQEVGSAAGEVQAVKARETMAAADAAEGRAKRSALLAAAEQMEERKSALDRDREALETRVESARKDSRDAHRALEDAEEQAEAVRNIIKGYALRMEGREKRAKDAADVHMKLTMESRELQSRIRLLSEMEREYEGFNKAVRATMQASDRGILRGIHGPVAGLIHVDDRFAVAIEVALGAGMQNIVVDREEDAKSAIQFLKQRDKGRATFLPLTAIRGQELRERGLEEARGFIGIASRLVTYDKRYDEIFVSLLGRTVIAEDLDAGIAMARAYQHRFKIVTLDGQVVNRGGSMTGGSAPGSAGILSRANELTALKGRQKTMEEKLLAAQKEKETADRELNAARFEMESAQGQRRLAEDEVLRLQGRKAQTKLLLEELERSLENFEGEKEALTQRLGDSRREAEAVELEIRQHEARAQALHEEAEERLKGQTDLLARSDKLSEDVTARRAEMAGLAAEEEATAKALGDMERMQADLAGDRAMRQSRMEEYAAAIEENEAKEAERRAAAKAFREEAKAALEKLTALREEKLAFEQDRGSMGRRIKDCNDLLLNAEREVGRLEQRLSAGQWEEKQILDKLWENYELSHSAAMEQRVELPSAQKAARRVSELKREIGGLGQVNVGAIQEFDRVNGRYTYLTGQRDDVDKAKTELQKIIEDITREMTGIFGEQFKLIDTAFQETFQDLFGGGRAHLELEDPEDILNCGIEIRVQPPGKTLKTITLLSGGEKAFVAIALYFAILKVHPTPFCVMDEIEAALDDANVGRYARYMRSFTDKTQFIVITHRRGTMEEADTLYGVTMQEEGVSKMLTIDLNDVAKELELDD